MNSAALLRPYLTTELILLTLVMEVVGAGFLPLNLPGGGRGQEEGQEEGGGRHGGQGSLEIIAYRDKLQL